MTSIDIGGELDLGDGRRVKVLPFADERIQSNLRCFDADGLMLWAATGEFSGAWWDGTTLTAYHTSGFNMTIDDQTGQVLKSIFTK